MTQAIQSDVRSRRVGAVAYLSQPSNLLFVVVLALVMLTHGFVFFATLVIAPIGFDEAFNLQAPLNLLEGRGYATEDWLFGGPRLAFDAIISTGPVVLLPAAASMGIFGTSIEAARIVMLPFLALLLTCLYILGNRIAGRWAGVAAAASVLFINTRVDWPITVIYGPSDALGEFAAAALLALALVLLPRHRIGAGLAIGFAALAKFMVFMAVPAFVIALLLVAPGVPAVRRVRRRLVEILTFLVAVALPSIGWEVVKLVSLGGPAYLDSLVGYLRFVFRSGSGADGGGGRALFLERASRLFAAWHLPTLLIIICAVLLFALAAVGAWQWLAPEPGRPRGSRSEEFWAAIRRVPVEVWAAIGTLAVLTLWWSFIASSIFVRHTMPVLIGTVPVVVALAIKGAQRLIAQPARWLRVATIVLVACAIVAGAVQAAMTVEASTRPEDWTRAQQQEAADFIRSLGVNEVQGIGWWAAPELRFLSHVPSTPIGTGTGPLVLEPITRELDPATYALGLDMCADVLYQRDGFVVCEVKSGIEPLDYGDVR